MCLPRRPPRSAIGACLNPLHCPTHFCVFSCGLRFAELAVARDPRYPHPRWIHAINRRLAGMAKQQVAVGAAVEPNERPLQVLAVDYACIGLPPTIGKATGSLRIRVRFCRRRSLLKCTHAKTTHKCTIKSLIQRSVYAAAHRSSLATT